MNLKSLRKQIDQLDTHIVTLLNKRAGVILHIAKLKQTAKKSIYSPEREREVLKRIGLLAKGPLDKNALSAIYREIMSASLALEKPLKIAYLGPQATFTHLAALKRFGSQLEYMPCKSITDIFVEVERGTVDYGVVPIENSVEGAVSHTLDMFMDSDLKICSQITLGISHNLLAKCSKEKIRRVYSIAQVFGQCRIWLQENLPHVDLIEVSSTTRAAEIAAKERGSASISSLLAASVYGLKVVAKGIEDSPHNITRFLVIAKNDASRTGEDKTSLMFSIKDRVGALHDMLLPFAKYRINLTKIESRPSKKKAWDYYFFLDLLGHRDEPKIKKAIFALENKCKFLKVLGSYPLGD